MSDTSVKTVQRERLNQLGELPLLHKREDKQVAFHSSHRFVSVLHVRSLHDKGLYRELLRMFWIVCLKTSVLFSLSCVLILFQKRLLQTLQLCPIFLFSLYNTAKLSQPRSNMAASIRGEKKAVNSERLHQKFVWLCTVMWGQS